MELFVLRHGKAGEGYPDELRELTVQGRRDVEEVIGGCAEKIGLPEQIQASSLVRAQQTAEIAKNSLEFQGEILTNESLVPWSSPSEFVNSLDDHLNSILVASHQPFVSSLVEFLTGERIAMRTSTLVAIELEFVAQDGGNLLWVESP